MYSIVAVDDELVSLNRIERLLKKQKNVNSIDTFLSVSKALEHISKNNINLVFLDIEMPEINGIELAAKITEIDSNIDIVFVTAHEQFALKAFNVYASGYLLKPISLEDIEKVLNIIEKRHNKILKYKDKKNKLFVSSFGNICCTTDLAKTNKVKWRTQKCEELILYLIQSKTPVSRDCIIESLWPDMDIENAIKNLHVTCYNIRSALKKLDISDIIKKNHGIYKLEDDLIVSDYLTFTEKIENIKKIDEIIPYIEDIEYIVSKSKSGYLNNRYYEWGFQKKDWITIEVEQVLYKMLKKYDADGDLEKGVDTLLNIISLDDYEDDAYDKLIKMSISMGLQKLSAIVFKKYEQISMESDIKISLDVIKLIKNI